MNESTGRHLRLVHSVEESTTNSIGAVRGFYTESTTKDINLDMIFDSLRKRGDVYVKETTPYEITGIIIGEDGRESDFRIVLETGQGVNSKSANIRKATRAIIILVLAGVVYGTYVMASEYLSEPATMERAPAKASTPDDAQTDT